MVRLLVLIAVLLASPLMAAEKAVPAPAPQAVAAKPAAAPVSILVVDVKRILDESKASVGVQKKIEGQRSAFQAEIATREKTIRDAEQELLSSRGKIASEVYAQKENELRQKFREVEKYVQDRRRVLEQATTLSMGKVRSVLLGIVTEVAHERGSQAVLVKQQVLWSEAALDVTDIVLDRLNAKLPELPVDVLGPVEGPKPSKTP